MSPKCYSIGVNKSRCLARIQLKIYVVGEMKLPGLFVSRERGVRDE